MRFAPLVGLNTNLYEAILAEVLHCPEHSVLLQVNIMETATAKQGRIGANAARV